MLLLPSPSIVAAAVRITTAVAAAAACAAAVAAAAAAAATMASTVTVLAFTVRAALFVKGITTRRHGELERSFVGGHRIAPSCTAVERSGGGAAAFCGCPFLSRSCTALRPYINELLECRKTMKLAIFDIKVNSRTCDFRPQIARRYLHRNCSLFWPGPTYPTYPPGRRVSRTLAAWRRAATFRSFDAHVKLREVRVKLA